MATKTIEVNTTSLRNDILSLDQEIAGLKKNMQALRSAAAQLSTSWDGSAKEAFIRAVQNDIGMLEQLIGAIEQFNDKVDASRTEYDRCENAVSGLIASIRV